MTEPKKKKDDYLMVVENIDKSKEKQNEKEECRPKKENSNMLI